MLVWRETIPEREAGFQAAVVELGALHGWKAYHTYDSRRSEEGFLDLVLVRPGDPVIFAEVKGDRRRKPSDAQTVWICLLQAAEGCEVYCWWPKDWEAIRSRLTRPARPVEGWPPAAYVAALWRLERARTRRARGTRRR